MDRQKDRETRQLDECSDRRIDGQTEGKLDTQRENWTHRGTDRLAEGWRDK